MEIIDIDKLQEANNIKPTIRDDVRPVRKYSEEEFNVLLRDMQNPVKAQKEMALKVKLFLDEKMAFELESKGTLSDATKRWVDSYTSMLEKLQKAIHGDKSIHLNIHAIGHGDIAKKIREAR